MVTHVPSGSELEREIVLGGDPAKEKEAASDL